MSQISFSSSKFSTSICSQPQGKEDNLFLFPCISGWISQYCFLKVSPRSLSLHWQVQKLPGGLGHCPHTGQVQQLPDDLIFVTYCPFSIYTSPNSSILTSNFNHAISSEPLQGSYALRIQAVSFSQPCATSSEHSWSHFPSFNRN